MKKNGSGKRLRRLIRDLLILHLTLKSSIVTIVIKYKILRDFQISLHYVHTSILLLFPLSSKIFIIIHNVENKY